jgi:NitT/TauT family transport system ATP-binding protein
MNTPDCRPAAGRPAMKPFVDFRNVWLAYNDELLAQGHFAVEDITLQVNQGEFIAIVGPRAAARAPS